MKIIFILMLILAMNFSLDISSSNAESKLSIVNGNTIYNVHPIAISKKDGVAKMILKWNKVEGAIDYTIKIYDTNAENVYLEKDVQVFHTKNTKIKISESRSFEKLPKNFRLYVNMQNGTVNEMWFKNGRNINLTKEQFIKNMVKKAFYKKPKVKDLYKAKAKQIWKLTNKERISKGLSPLIWSNKAYKAAKIRAKELTAKFSHKRPNGTSYALLLNNIGIRWTVVGENIAVGQRTPRAVIRDWMHSPGHRKNILNKNFKYLAVGVHYYKGRFYYVQNFCTF